MRKIYYLFMLCLLSTALFAQKQPLTHDVYDDWKSIQTVRLSDDGNWLAYRIAPQVGDAVLELKNLGTDEVITIDRVSRYAFSANSQFVAAEVKPGYELERELKLKKTAKSKMPKDSLYVINLANGEMTKVGRVKNYQLPEDSKDWIAWLHEKPLPAKKKKEKTEKVEDPEEEGISRKERKRRRKAQEAAKEEVVEEVKDPREKSKGTELVLFNMSSGEQKSITGVMDYKLAQNGKYLFFEYDKVDSLNPAGIHAMNTATGEMVTLSERMESYKKMTVSEDGKRMAFFATANDKDDDHQYYSLMHWMEGANEAQIVADTLSSGLADGWMVSDNSTIRFSESGERLYFGTAPRPVEYDYESDTTILKEERPQVDVWSYNDPYIQPMQKLQAAREKNRSYEALLGEDGSIIQLEDLSLESVSVDYDNDRDYYLGMDDKAYRVQYTWDVQLPRDYYLVDANTGEKTMLEEGLIGFASMSSDGKYMTWFNSEDGHWYAKEIASGTTRNLTENISVSFANELHDSPSLAGSYGGAGWTENDEHFLLYDRYDIWAIDPSGSNEAVNLTQGAGRANKVIYRYTSLDREADFIDTSVPALLSVFNEWTKASGYAKVDLANGSTPENILVDDMRIYGLTKAKDADRVMLRKSTYEEYPEIYLADSWADIASAEKLTDMDAQEDPYNWGTAELIEFNSGFDGEKMQAIMYKPENFDPNKKYPMIVYFYERRSSSLHNHLSPAPSASTVNIPYFVSNDYVVLVPDIKYEVGYPGRSAMNHVVPATQAAVDMGFIDESKMAIQGQSWGGYQVAYMVTKTDMYAAAGAGAPVSNMTSAYGGVRWGSGMSRMFQYEKTQTRIGATLWERPDLYIENSPIFSMPDIETPLFIMHNDADGAVPWYQGIEFYMSLRRLQKPAWMVVYNDEAHNLRQRKNRKDLSVRMGQFFDHYLKGEPMPVWMAKGLPATLKGRTLGYELTDEMPTQKMKEGESLNTEKKGQN
jgi:dipeptidyl aminopeptidase/acylaminoacyl peptidase